MYLISKYVHYCSVLFSKFARSSMYLEEPQSLITAKMMNSIGTYSYETINMVIV